MSSSITIMKKVATTGADANHQNKLRKKKRRVQSFHSCNLLKRAKWRKATREPENARGKEKAQKIRPTTTIKTEEIPKKKKRTKKTHRSGVKNSDESGARPTNNKDSREMFVQGAGNGAKVPGKKVKRSPRIKGGKGAEECFARRGDSRPSVRMEAY